MDIKRSILLVIFSLSILILWDNWSKSNLEKVTSKSKTFKKDQSRNSKDELEDFVPSQTIKPVPKEIDDQISFKTDSNNVEDEFITIKTDLLKVDVNINGGEIVGVELLKHFDTNQAIKQMVIMEKNDNRTYITQSGLIGGDFPDHRSRFTILSNSRTLTNSDKVTLILESAKDQITLTKKYIFKKGEYEIDLIYEIKNDSEKDINPSAYFQIIRDKSLVGPESAFYHTFTGPAIYTQKNKFQKISFDEIDKGKNSPVMTENGWISMVQHYFVSAFLPPRDIPHEFFTRKVGNLYAVGTIMNMGKIEAKGKSSISGKLFVGPQIQDNMEKFSKDFDLVKDYGWLTIIAKPIFWLMDQIHKIVGNWGWTIIILTILIKLVFYPLSAASYKSMAKMKLVTPKMTSIRERFKGDQQKMNAAMMDLYKTEKINPLGGCLPILIQIPVFIALYWVLLASVEIRHAPWMGWIHDLSAPDNLFGNYNILGFDVPLGLLPIIMAISMFIQTKLNPTPPDPLQAKIMLFMPIIFSVMFFFFPSGLVLYWVVNNILSIIQQWVITKQTQEVKT